MRIRVDESVCIGAGQCVMTAPDVFDQRDTDGVSYVVGSPDDHAAAARDAAGLCPSGAITIDED